MQKTFLISCVFFSLAASAETDSLRLQFDDDKVRTPFQITLTDKVLELLKSGEELQCFHAKNASVFALSIHQERFYATVTIPTGLAFPNESISGITTVKDLEDLELKVHGKGITWSAHHSSIPQEEEVKVSFEAKLDGTPKQNILCRLGASK